MLSLVHLLSLKSIKKTVLIGKLCWRFMLLFTITKVYLIFR